MKLKVILTGIVLFVAIVFKTKAQVNLQTGAAEFSLPLYSYSDVGNRLATGVSLNYTAGNGLKVSDVGTAVGTGWALNFGGVITRIQHGEPDDQKQDGTFSYPSVQYIREYYPNGYLYSEYDPSVPIDAGAGYMPMFPSSYVNGYQKPAIYLSDRELDMFSFSFNGRTGYFIIGKNGDIKTIVDSKLKIEKVITDMSADNIITRISEFRIIDETGIKYVFKDLELSELMRYGAYFPEVNTKITVGKGKNKFIVGKWFLSEIINPQTSKNILFTYENYNIDMPGNKSGYRSFSEGKEDVSLTLEKIKGVSKRIKQIKCSEKEEVEFVYTSEDRYDPPFDKALDEIRIEYDNVTRYSWKMSYAYFVKNQTKSFRDAFTQDQKYQSRLCLLSIQKKGTQAEPPYTFDYYNGTITYRDEGIDYTAQIEVSPLFSFYQDHKGYPNRTNSYSYNNYLDEPRLDLTNSNVNWTHIAQYVTNSVGIRNPTGLNLLGGVLKSVKNPFGGTLDFIYEKMGNGTQAIVGGLRVTNTIAFDGINHDNDIIKEYKYIKANGSSSHWGHESPVYQSLRKLRVYACGDGIKPAAIVSQAASSIPSMLSNKVQWGQFGPVDWSDGARVQAITDLIAMIVIYFLYEILAPDYYDYDTYEWSTYSKTAANSLPFQYSRVEVTDKLLSGTSGKTIFEFTSDEDYPIDVQNLAVPNSTRQRFAYWSYGLPKNTYVYDHAGNILRKTEYTYQVFKNTLNDNNYVSQKWLASDMTYDCDFSGVSDFGIARDIYYPMCGRTELSQVKEYVYNRGFEYAVTTKDFEYSTSNYQPVKVKTSNSKGELIENVSYYPHDYTLTGIIQTMKEKNMLNVPVSSQSFITKGGQKYLLGGSVSEFDVAANNDIKPIKTYHFQSSNPIVSTSVAFNSAQLLPSTTYYKETGSVAYDNKGMPVQMSADNGIISTLYDYNNKLAVATVANAANDKIAYTSFEADGEGKWTRSGTVLTAGGITGNKSFSGTVSKALSQAGNFIVTAWAKDNSSITVNSTNGTLIHTIGAWKLYQWQLSNVSSVQVTGTNMDEVRMYPPNARMSTVAYDPVFGKIAECDATSRLLYYEYDGLGRLRFERDENRNIIKMYEYNYKR